MKKTSTSTSAIIMT